MQIVRLHNDMGTFNVCAKLALTISWFLWNHNGERNFSSVHFVVPYMYRQAICLSVQRSNFIFESV